MTLLVTGCTGFNGSNFFLDWLAPSYQPVVSLDKLTCAGNFENLASLHCDPLHVFVQGDRTLIDTLPAQHRTHDELHFAAES